jgi:hypothetical protein
MRYKATIDIYVDLDDRTYPDAEGALADGISATMQQAIEASEGFLIDWAYNSDGESYRYAEPFEGETPEEELQSSFAAQEPN